MKPSELHSPKEVGELALLEIEERLDKTIGGIRAGIGSLDKHLLPLRPGNLCMIQAYTSNYKTGFMMSWARMLAQGLLDKQDLNHCVIYVSWEDTIEEIGVYDLVNASSVHLNQAELSGNLSDADKKAVQGAES